MGNRFCCCFKSENSNVNNNLETKLELFSFKDIRCECKIEKIIDGDTFVCSFKINYIDLENKSVIFIPVQDKNIFIYLKLKCRLFGVDAAEKNTIQGQIATLLVSSILIPNQIYNCLLHSSDKYGRQLITFYDSNDQNIQNKLISYSHPKHGKVYCEYDGKKKTEFINLEKHKIQDGKLIVKNKIFVPSLTS